MTRILTFIVLWFAMVLPLSANGAGSLSRAMDEMRSGDWSDALQLARRDGQVARDIIEWHRLRAGRGDYAEIADFIDRRADWPGMAWLLRKSEPEIARQPHAQVRAIFDRYRPQTARGWRAYARALADDGRKGEAEAGIVMAWRTLPMPAEVQAAYMADYSALLRPHHEARLDRMIWQSDLASARRALPLVSDGHRMLANARVGLHDQAPGVDTLIEAVPENLRDHPGLAYERFNWRARKGRDASARELLLATSTSAQALGDPATWASRRRTMARADLRAGNPESAYRIASTNFLTEGSDYADLEWLSGFIALRFLNDPATALRHFQRFDDAVVSPISQGRAGYWIGRAHEALGATESAMAAYRDGAQYQTSYYGILAAERAELPFDTNLAGAETPPAWREAAFTSSSVFKAGLLLLAAGELDLGERFLTHLTESLDETQAAQLGAMALEMDRPHLAVMIGKRAAQRGIVIPAPYYAVHAVAAQRLPMATEMTLAIARRESEFDPKVVSGVGARGLMQVMPGTARDVARDLGGSSEHSTGRLLSDWRYNAKLGATYLSQLADRFDGNVVMMAAAYNAGPSRPTRWMSQFGDPREGDIDIIDWVEMIPFRETRNYVMRVTESLPIYRARLGKDPLPVPFTEELIGSTLRAFAQ